VHIERHRALNLNSKPRRAPMSLVPMTDRAPLRSSTMRNNETFTILSTTAPLVEVTGDGPFYDTPGGLLIPDGAATTVALDLAAAPIRRFRIDASPATRTAVLITDSPYGASVHVRRCFVPEPSPKWWRPFDQDDWPDLRRRLKRHAPSLHALWNLLTDDVEPCTWRDLCHCSGNQPQTAGGDVVVISFVRP
jgi:hypothetical protein